jgi:hypothetical protein
VWWLTCTARGLCPQSRDAPEFAAPDVTIDLGQNDNSNVDDRPDRLRPADPGTFRARPRRKFSVRDAIPASTRNGEAGKPTSE